MTKWEDVNQKKDFFSPTQQHQWSNNVRYFSWRQSVSRTRRYPIKRTHFPHLFGCSCVISSSLRCGCTSCYRLRMFAMFLWCSCSTIIIVIIDSCMFFFFPPLRIDIDYDRLQERISNWILSQAKHSIDQTNYYITHHLQYLLCNKNTTTFNQ